MKLARAIPSISLFFSLSVAVLLVVLVVQGRAATTNRDQGLRTFICYFENAVLKSPQTPAQRQKTIRFFDGLAVKLHEPPCLLR